MFQFLGSSRQQMLCGAGLAFILILSGASKLPGQTPYAEDEILVSRNFMGNPVPKWENGFLVGFEFVPERSPTVYAYGRGGNKLFETQLGLDGAYKVTLRAMAASPDGRFAFSGVAENGSPVRKYFIAFLDSTGRILRVNVDGFAAGHLCFSPDGTLWAASKPVLQYPAGTAPDHDILRAYAPDGNLKFTMLPRSSFAGKAVDPLQTHPISDDENGTSQLAANESEVVFLSSGFQEFVRVTLSGKLLQRGRMERPAKSFLTGFALAATGAMFLSTQEEVPGDPKKVNFVFYRWNLANSKWTELFTRSSQERGLPISIAMAENDRMLVKSSEGRFRWIRPSAGEYSFRTQP